MGMKLPEVKSVEPFENKFPAKCSPDLIDLMKVGLIDRPLRDRSICSLTHTSTSDSAVMFLLTK